MVDSRSKGATYERDIVKKLNTFFSGCGFDITCKRNLDQYQTADLCDIQIPHHAIECKAYKEGWWWKPEWWKQVTAACHNDSEHAARGCCLGAFAIRRDVFVRHVQSELSPGRLAHQAQAIDVAETANREVCGIAPDRDVQVVTANRGQLGVGGADRAEHRE